MRMMPPSENAFGKRSKPRRSRPPGVPIAIEGQGLAAVLMEKCFVGGRDPHTPDGGIWDAGVLFFPEQEMQAQWGK